MSFWSLLPALLLCFAMLSMILMFKIRISSKNQAPESRNRYSKIKTYSRTRTTTLSACPPIHCLSWSFCSCRGFRTFSEWSIRRTKDLGIMLRKTYSWGTALGSGFSTWIVSNESDFPMQYASLSFSVHATIEFAAESFRVIWRQTAVSSKALSPCQYGINPRHLRWIVSRHCGVIYANVAQSTESARRRVQ